MSEASDLLIFFEPSGGDMTRVAGPVITGLGDGEELLTLTRAPSSAGRSR